MRHAHYYGHRSTSGETSVIFEPGDKALLIDSSGRRYLITLAEAGAFHFHRGIVQHDDIIGHPDGVTVRATTGATLRALYPTYADYVLKMPRGAQVIYPKDVAMILVQGDIYPGATVLEAGIGSGALTMALLRAVGESGRVIAYEVREDFAGRAHANIEGFGMKTSNLEIHLGSVYEQVGLDTVDRVVLDLAEPWRALPQLVGVLRSGGILACFLPTILQVHQLTLELQADPRWTSVSTVEALTRTWHIEGRSVRPNHRMVAHTGFITVARLTSDDGGVHRVTKPK
jgi:tRNA (adenine57-N1/adenine58-N1)-methyltransferase catalytic subunit